MKSESYWVVLEVLFSCMTFEILVTVETESVTNMFYNMAYLTCLKNSALKLKCIQLSSSTKGIGLFTAPCITQTFWCELASRSNTVHWSNRKQVSRHSIAVKTSRDNSEGIVLERRFPLIIRRCISLWLMSNLSLTAVSSQASRGENVWKIKTKTTVKSNLAILVFNLSTVTSNWPSPNHQCPPAFQTNIKRLWHILIEYVMHVKWAHCLTKHQI